MGGGESVRNERRTIQAGHRVGIMQGKAVEETVHPTTVEGKTSEGNHGAIRRIFKAHGTYGVTLMHDKKSDLAASLWYECIDLLKIEGKHKEVDYISSLRLNEFKKWVFGTEMVNVHTQIRLCKILTVVSMQAGAGGSMDYLTSIESAANPESITKSRGQRCALCKPDDYTCEIFRSENPHFYKYRNDYDEMKEHLANPTPQLPKIAEKSGVIMQANSGPMTLTKCPFHLKWGCELTE